MNEQELIAILLKAKEQYYNGGDSDLSDVEFDNLEEALKQLNPNSSYFDVVGSSIRTGKINLPYVMGSLDQLQVGEYNDWHEKNKSYLITDKLDGSAAMITYNHGNLSIAYSRGNGIQGADITRHLLRMKNVPKTINYKNQLTIRAEIILKKNIEEQIRNETTKITGRNYKNARNYVAGQMNSEVSVDPFYDNVDVVAYTIMNDININSKKETIEFLQSLGFMTANNTYIEANNSFNENQLGNLLIKSKENTLYEIDGLVIELNQNTDRNSVKQRESSLNPAYAKKYKLASNENTTISTVVDVHWNPSKNSYLKPRIEITPVDLTGVTITFATGFNAKFIKDNNIGPGSIVEIVRSGDVIPYITKVLESTSAKLPDLTTCHWSENNVDLILNEINDEVKIEKLNFFFESLEVDSLRKKTVEALYYNGFDTIEKIIKSTDFSFLGPKAGPAIVDGIKKGLNTTLPRLATAYGSYGIGVGNRKLKKVYEKYSNFNTINDPSVFLDVEGIEQKTAEKICNGNTEFNNFLENIKDYYMFIEEEKLEKISNELEGQYIVFTGIRDQSLTDAIISKGGEVGDSKSKMTILVAKDINTTTSKITEARKKGAKVVSYDEALTWL